MKRHFLMKSAGIALSVALFGLGLRSDAVSRDEPKGSASTIDRAVEFVFQKGDAWIQERKCVSCHMIPSAVWGLSEYRSSRPSPNQSFEVRYRKLVDWTLKDAARVNPGHEGVAQLLLANLTQDKSAGTHAKLDGFARTLMQKQSSDGSWSPGGQTPEQRRSAKEGREVVTMWAILALDRVLGKEAAPAVKQGRATLTGGADKQSNEWHVLRYQLALRFEEESAKKELLKKLLDSQNADGGWGWLLGKESDAMATGQTLYALSFAPRDRVRKVADKAIEFLESSQREDGSWAVKGTLAHRQSVVIPTSVYWGATWAVIGLSRWN